MIKFNYFQYKQFFNGVIWKKKFVVGLIFFSSSYESSYKKILYTIAIYTGTGIQKPDYLATIDCDQIV